ncbi:serine/threonine-protein kinase [Streptosporangium sp. KLBMP 9127]|nr:serine/threonine-protein kinase [Streptosporangium sp. KLBMP 9127]
MGNALIDGDPQRLGEYWLAGRLGAGGQGVVYEAYDAEGVRVAVKVLHGDPAENAELRERMGREATAAQRVASFCTARVLASDLTAARPYIVSEYVEGPSLRGAVTGGRRFAGDDLYRLATAIATALTAIHEAGVVHRDLKPDNVMLGPDGPRVIDFGVARTMEMSLTSTGIATGTPTYMPPEVFMGERAGMPADVFAWGAIVLFAAVGEDPFRADSLGAVMHRVLSVDPDLGVLPGSLRDLVAAALAKEPGGRPTASELLLALISGDGRLDMARLLAEGSRAAGEVVSAAPVDPALGTLAEDSYGTLSPADRELVPEVFLRLVTVTDDGALAVRRASRAEILDGRPEHEAEGVVRILGAFSYLISAGEEIAFTRPALPYAWPRLRAWIRANREGLAVHRGIATAARRWHTQGRRAPDLFQGGDLDGALRWAATERRNITLTPVERDFLDAGAALTRRRARRNRLVTVAMAVLLVAALVASFLAVRQSGQLTVQRDEAEARRIAAVADGLRTTDPAQAMLLSVAAWRLAPVAEARAALTGSLAQRKVRTFTDPAAQARRLLSGDGRTLVSVGDDAARAWDVRTGERIGGVDRLGTDGRRVLGASLSPSGRTLAVATVTGIRLWDVKTGDPLPGTYPSASEQIHYDIYFGEAEHLLTVILGDSMTVWNTHTGRRTGLGDCCAPVPLPDEKAVIMPLLDGRGVHRFALPQGERAALVERCTSCSVAVSPDSRLIAVGEGTEIVLRDARTGEQRDGAPMTDWNGGTLRFSPDGTMLASAAPTGVQVWRPADSVQVLDHSVSGTGGKPAFDPDGRTLRYLDGDTVVTFDLPADVRPGGRRWDALSPDGRLLAARVPDTGEVRLSDGRLLGSGRRGEIHTFHAAFSQDGTLVADGGHTQDGEINVSTIADPAKRVTLRDASVHYPDALAFSPDKRRLVTIGAPLSNAETRVIMWDLAAGRALWRLNTTVAREVTFTPDGRSVMLRYEEEVRRVDAVTGRLTGPATLDGGSRGLRFAADGTVFAPGDASGHLKVWAAGTAGPRELILRGPTRGIVALAFSPDGKVLATGDSTGTLTLWDTGTGRPLGRPATERVSGFRTLAFSWDGSRLLTLDTAGGFAEYPVDPARLPAAVCERAGRGLSEREWRTYLPDTPYSDPCPARRAAHGAS